MTTEDYQGLLFRVRIVLADRFGIEQGTAEEMIDELRDAGIAFREVGRTPPSRRGLTSMSSTYYLLCMSHDPATVITQLGDPESLPNPDDLQESHPHCDFVISRLSGAPVEFGCPGFGACPCGGHSGIRWVDADWLRVLRIALDARTSDTQRLRDKRHTLKCWNFERLNGLRYELGE